MPPEPQRRDTPAEGMPAVQHVSEAADHFVVTYADGKSAIVPKDGLKADTLAHMQGMAHGGEVIAGGRIDPGGANDDNPPDAPDGTLTEGRSEHPPRMSHPAVTPSEQDAGPPSEEERSIQMADGGTVPDAGFRQGQFAPFMPAPGADAGSVAFMPAPIGPLVPSPDGTGFIAAPPMAFDAGPGGLIDPSPIEQRHTLSTSQKREQELADWKARNDVPMPVAQTPGPVTSGGVPTPTAPTPPPAGAPPPALPGMGGSGALTELNKGLAEQRAGLAAQVEVEKQRDAALMKIQDAHIAQMQELEARGAEQLAAHQRRADDLFQATLNAKIDPNRVWASADTGQRIAAGIGILLSGIGQGLGGGPNMALQVIDRTIDRDIDAQKTNLENQRSLLSHYLQRGRDMLSAQQLAKADLKDMFAAQLQRSSTEYGGAEAAARAQMLGGQIRIETATKRQDVIGKDLALSQARLQMQQQQEMQRALNAAMHPTGGQAPMHPAMAALVMSGPEKMNEHAVQVPVFDGRGTTWQTRYAFNKETVKDATNAFRKNQNIRGLVQELDAIHKAHPLGSPLPGDVAKRAKIVANNLKLEWLGGEAGLNRLNERESEYLDQMIVNPADVFSTGQGGAIDELAHDVEQNQRNLEGSYLIPQGR